VPCTECEAVRSSCSDSSVWAYNKRR
jgi:hypothetical protein